MNDFRDFIFLATGKTRGFIFTSRSEASLRDRVFKDIFSSAERIRWEILKEVDILRDIPKSVKSVIDIIF